MVRCLSGFLGLDPDPGSIQKHAYLMRLCKRVRHHYDLVVGTDNEGDFGPPAIQYIHYPFLAHLYPRVRSSCDLPLGQKLACLSKGEIRPWMLVGDYSFDRMKANHTLVNSGWTGRWVSSIQPKLLSRNEYGIEILEGPLLFGRRRNSCSSASKQGAHSLF